MNIPPKQFIETLVQKQLITQEEGDKYEMESLNKNLPIYDYLLVYGKLKKSDILKSQAELLHVPFVDINTIAVSPEALAFISESIARKYIILPYSYDSKTDSIYVATAHPLDFSLNDFLEKKTNKRIILSLGNKEDIIKSINMVYIHGLSPEVKEALAEVSGYNTDNTSEQITTIVKEAPIAKIVNTILEFAMKGRASDIHIEPQEDKTRIRYRIDGVLQEKLTLPRSIHDSLASRIKILSQMKIDERRIPQDGRFSFKVGNEEVDLRVSSLPTVHGEKIVMRILKKTGGLPMLHELGLRGTQYKDLEEAILKPYGIILVTGPTGSGKTTTLYSILTKLNKPSVNIVTLEDPVEYEIVGINQVQINPQAGLTFGAGLRSFLRQDPNIILVGEIRDKETAQLAIQAALTGHLVFSTLHTNDAATAIPRLIDLGAEPFLISSVLNASVAQRISRTVCPHCKEQYEPVETIKENIKSILGPLLPAKYQTSPIMLSRGKGCVECNFSGYLGRIAIFEVLKITPIINKMILQQASAREIEAQAKKDSLIIMKQDGYLKALEGITSLEEVLRVAEV
ncbi:type II secretion system protein GspE [Candidatus Roizmanbacteria bacterium CG_4_10_14_0_8_um_filter_33_9]|uniref:Type II secretion system protein GspE n=1 Tax=Candidatus Roizmanbacteria bacterium CG_4_10_14_0_8_um_filter_33_9 TaxID=1974826 RepID=A0A2M7QJ00_9BACT|nr:MAG: type II secretion system protein GspE [Candidatus Roizmanbacteria bacterium CG_4_10_14_0_8_um_filter_33_9]